MKSTISNYTCGRTLGSGASGIVKLASGPDG